jgi:hypothetical protein
MSLMPCFDKGQGLDESTVLARLLAGYGEIELQMCMCLIVVEGDIDTPIRADRLSRLERRSGARWEGRAGQFYLSKAAEHTATPCA